MGIEATAPQGAAPQPSPTQEPAGDPGQLVQGIHDQLISLLEMMDRAPGIAPEAKQQLGTIIQQYRDFVSKELLGEQAPQAPQGGVGNVAPQAGAAQVSPV